jgi:hypothetical protein
MQAGTAKEKKKGNKQKKIQKIILPLALELARSVSGRPASSCAFPEQQQPLQ